MAFGEADLQMIFSIPVQGIAFARILFADVNLSELRCEPLRGMGESPEGNSDGQQIRSISD
jgi:hypothetical protein